MINKKLKYSYLVTLLGLSTNSIALVVPGTSATIYYPKDFVIYANGEPYNVGSPGDFDTFKKIFNNVSTREDRIKSFNSMTGNYIYMKLLYGSYKDDLLPIYFTAE